MSMSTAKFESGTGATATPETSQLVRSATESWAVSAAEVHEGLSKPLAARGLASTGADPSVARAIAGPASTTDATSAGTMPERVSLTGPAESSRRPSATAARGPPPAPPRRDRGGRASGSGRYRTRADGHATLG